MQRSRDRSRSGGEDVPVEPEEISILTRASDTILTRIGDTVVARV
jgi:hypothetical protein